MNTQAGVCTNRLKLTLHGMVQGVGFRPFVHHLATEIGLTGWVKNSAHGLQVEVEGSLANLHLFLTRIQQEIPPHAFVQSLESCFLDPHGYTDFQILESAGDGEKKTLILPDLAPCADCVHEIFDPKNRHFRYPFTNCTHCGPRYSILETVPYDRVHTSMRKFTMCPQCRSEYEDPQNRRFHAQPNACPHCGPQLELWDKNGKVLAKTNLALESAARRILDGKIVAVKGIGGFHLMADAFDENAVKKLRERKQREEKPFALMAPDLETVLHYCDVTEQEQRLLMSAQAPIVLLRRSQDSKARALAEGVAIRNPYLGIMLPSSPLHHLLLKEVGGMVVATSGNLAEEPLITDEKEALARLGGVADYFLVHDRVIIRHGDDSIVRVVAGREMILRRARGYAPLPVVETEKTAAIFSVGAHLKNTVAQSLNGKIFLSQHLGDLSTAKSLEAFERTAAFLKQLYEAQPKLIACDFHPDYASSRYAEKSGLPVVKVQHHYAHALACMADNELQAPCFAVCWDGTGLGTDQTIWGGEFLLIQEQNFARIGHFRPFRLLGGDKAAEEPRRAALAVLYEIYGASIFEKASLKILEAFANEEKNIFNDMLGQGIQSPWTSSAGRLFDAVAALVGLRTMIQYEGQAAAELEFAADSVLTHEIYPLGSTLDRAVPVDSEKFLSAGAHLPMILFDWEPMIRRIVGDLELGVSAGEIAAKFHNTLAEVIVRMAVKAGQKKVLLTGGCFQNRYLLERTVERLSQADFKPYWHQRIPTNDGGIAVGQILGAVRELRKKGQV